MVANYSTDPPPWDLNETVNQWEDWVATPAREDEFPSPTYTHQEWLAIAQVDAAWLQFCEVTPQTITDDAVEMKRPEWQSLVLSAQQALRCLMVRGWLPEDELMGPSFLP